MHGLFSFAGNIADTGFLARTGYNTGLDGRFDVRGYARDRFNSNKKPT
jgi:hypothetical protein